MQTFSFAVIHISSLLQTDYTCYYVVASNYICSLALDLLNRAEEES